MRLAHVRIAAACLLGGGALALGALGSAQAAQLKPPAAAATATACEALPAAATASPSPSPSPSPIHAFERLPARSRARSPFPSKRGSPTASADDTTASVDVYIAASPSPSPSPGHSSLTADPTPSATSSAGATAQPELCVSLRRSQASIARGQAAGYVVQVSAESAPASDVSVTLSAEPASQKPAFTGGCTTGDGTASCAISSVSVKQPVVLRAQIPIASRAASVMSVKLTATASIAATQTWNPPTVAETTAVNAASSHRRSLASTPPLFALPLGPIPDLNGLASTVIDVGNASSLFPVITPSPAPSPASAAPPSPPAARPGTGPAADSRALSRAAPVIPVRVAGLVALALAVVLTVMRLSVRRRSGSRKAPG